MEGYFCAPTPIESEAAMAKFVEQKKPVSSGQIAALGG